MGGKAKMLSQIMNRKWQLFGSWGSGKYINPCIRSLVQRETPAEYTPQLDIFSEKLVGRLSWIIAPGEARWKIAET